MTNAQQAIVPTASRDNYVVFFFLGKAASEDDKVCRWPQWEQCFHLFDDLLKDFGKRAHISSEQVYVVPLRKLKNDPPEMRRVTLKDVKGLAKLPWSHESNQQWSLQTAASEPYPVELRRTRIASSKIGIPKLDGSGKEIADIVILVGDQEPVSAGYPRNQSLTLSVSARIHAGRPAAYWDHLVGQLAHLMCAVRVGRTTSPWSGSAMAGGGTFCLGHSSFACGSDSVDFNDTFHTWEYLDLSAGLAQR